MTSPWAMMTRKSDTTPPGGNSGFGNGDNNSNAQSQFHFDPTKPASSQNIPYQTEAISNAAKGFSFGPRPGPPESSTGGRPLLGSGSGGGAPTQPQQVGMAIGRGAGARVPFKPGAQPGRQEHEEEEDWGAAAKPQPVQEWGALPPPQQKQEWGAIPPPQQQQQQKQEWGALPPPSQQQQQKPQGQWGASSSPQQTRTAPSQQSALRIDNWSNELADNLPNPQPPSMSQPSGASSDREPILPQLPHMQLIPGDDEARPDETALICKALHRKMGLIKTKADLEVIHRDPSSPLHSVKSFEELNLKPELLQGIYAMGFRYPSRIQETALPILLSENPRHNLIAQSQSGTGKTAAFVLTMLMRIDVSRPYPQALCVAPTYELALQIGAVTEEMSRYMNGLNVGYAVRGSTTPGADSGPITSQVIIGTPGTVVDWGLKFRKIDLSKLNVFVLDEADVMIAMQGHRDSSFRIKTKLAPNCQLLLFSATYDEEVLEFAQKMVPNADVIKLKREELSLENVKQFVVRCMNDEDKYNAICAIYGSITVGQSMIFCERRDAADWLAGKMSKDGHQVGLLHGGLSVDMRANIIERFREAKERVLITTNVAARGIDIEQVTVVVNYDLPIDIKTRRIDFDTYLHRIGRTGRFGRVGLALNLISNAGEMEHVRAIESHFNRKIEALDVSDVEILASKLGDAQ